MNKNQVFFLLALLVFIIILFTVTRTKYDANFLSKVIHESRNQSFYPSVFCLIKTHPKNIQINKTLILFKIWAHKCDNYRFITLLPNHLRPKEFFEDNSQIIEVFDQFYMIQPKFLSKESHGNLTLKIYYSMIYIYEKFKKYDWYYIVDDDAYVNMRNLKEFLKDKPTNVSITFGYNFKVIVKNGYHSGGPGYALSKRAFTLMTRELIKDIRNCPNSGIDDTDVNACVRKYNGSMGNSRDEQKRERFLPMGLMNHFMGTSLDWLNGYGEMAPKKGLNCCADSLIAVHYMNSRDLVRLDLAFEALENNHRVYARYFGLLRPITFKNIIKNYILLEDIEKDSNKFSELVKF